MRGAAPRTRPWRAGRAGAALALALALALVAGCRSSDEFKGLKTQLLDSPEEYALEFRGVRSFNPGLLQRAAQNDLDDFVADDFSPAAVDDAAYAVRSFYLDRGFPFAEVGFELEAAPGQKPRVRFLVEEGARYRVGDVHFTGNASAEAGDLRGLLGGPTTRILGLGDLYFVQAEAEAARRAIEDLYYQRGHIEVRVEGPEIRFDEEGRRAHLSYAVREGPRYRITSLELDEAQARQWPAIDERLAAFVGRAYFPRISYEVRATAADVLANLGHPDAQATSEEEVDRETGEVRLRVAVQPGPEVRVGAVRIEGNTRTREAFILDRLDLEPGELYNRRLERRAFRELYSTGLFDSVTIRLEGQGSERELVVAVEEGETLSVWGEAGYGSWERARVLAGVTEQNLLGTGRTLRLEGKLAERARGAELFLEDPYTIDPDNVLGLTAFVEEREQVSFDSLGVGAGLNLTRHLTDSYRNVYGYEYRISRSSNVEVVLPGRSSEIQEDVNISALYLTNVYDSRDSFLVPRAGSWFRLRSEIANEALGSELSFAKLDGRVVNYQPLDEASLVAWTIRLGVIAPLGPTEVIPLQERFFNGGQNTVRSFREDQLGPTDVNGNQVGGEAYSVFSVEYRRDLPGSFAVALFVDAGNVSLDASDALEFADLRYGVGPGLRWLLPIGPVRLDWGVNPNPRQDEETWVLQFSLGIAF